MRRRGHRATQAAGLFGAVTTPLRSPAARRRRPRRRIELFQIGRYRDTPASTLPQGVRKLLDIGMAVVGWPRLLLLDEPTSGISIEEKFDLMEVVMSALKTRRITVLFVEHDMEIVARFADRVLAFYDGTVIADGTPQRDARRSAGAGADHRRGQACARAERPHA